MKIYNETLLSELAGNRRVARYVKNLYDGRVYFSFLRSKRELARLFDNHPITQEIENGASNSSSILGYGDLFSFIGFEENSQPTKQLRASLLKNTFLYDGVISKNGNQLIISYTLEIELDKIYAENPLPWALGVSWAERIETGLENFGYYISREGSGRSQGGIQASNRIRDSVFTPQLYLSEIAGLFLSVYPQIIVQ